MFSSPSRRLDFLAGTPEKLIVSIFSFYREHFIPTDFLFAFLFPPSLAVPPSKPKIFDERNQEVRLKLGPYKIGDEVSLKCSATGGKTRL